MHRGCISLGDVRSDQCHRLIPHSGRYLAIEEEGVEVEARKITNYCVECALQKGLAYYNEEKDERILTFFPKFEY